MRTNPAVRRMLAVCAAAALPLAVHAEQTITMWSQWPDEVAKRTFIEERVKDFQAANKECRSTCSSSRRRTSIRRQRPRCASARRRTSSGSNPTRSPSRRTATSSPSTAWAGAARASFSLGGSVSVVEPLGAETLVLVDLGGAAGEIMARVREDVDLHIGSPIALSFPASAAHLFDKESGKAIAADRE